EVALAKALQVGSSLPVHFTVGTNGQGRCLSDRDGWYWNSGRREAEAMELRKVVLAGLAGGGGGVFLLVTAKGRMRQTQDPGSVSDSDLRTVRIRLERSTCFGSCASYSLVIHGDGQVEYVGRSSVKETGAREARIEADQVRRLVSEFAK